MRTRVVFSILLFAGLVLLLVGWFRPQPVRPAAPGTTLALRSSAQSYPTVSTAAFKETTPQPVPLAPPATATENAAATPDARQLDDRIAELNTLAMKSDLDSLNLIVVALNDPNPQIRAAALEATIQFHSPDAIPSLQDALAMTEMPEEKVKIQGAIDFLKLPSLAQADPKSP